MKYFKKSQIERDQQYVNNLRDINLNKKSTNAKVRSL